MQVEQRRYQLPDGSVGDDYFHLKRPDAVLIIARDRQGRTLVERQYRRGIDRIITELPAGWIKEGEAPTAAAVRELREETGVTASHPELIGTTLAAQPAFCDMLGHVVRVDIKDPGDPSHWAKDERGADHDELIEYKLVTPAELEALIRDGELCSMGDLAALRLQDL
jgi:ADP-ribose pyrophosphatase